MKTYSIQKVIYTIKHMYMHMNRVNSSLTLHEQEGAKKLE